MQIKQAMAVFMASHIFQVRCPLLLFVMDRVLTFSPPRAA